MNSRKIKKIINIIVVLMIFAFIVTFLVHCIIGLRERVMNLQYQVDSLCEYVELENCFGCDTSVKVTREDDLYYIECDTCHVRSGIYKSVVEAIEVWNDLCKD